MRRAFITNDNPATAVGLALGFALHQHRDAACQGLDLAGLFGDDFRHFVGLTFKMREAFFKGCFVAHAASVSALITAWEVTRLAPHPPTG